MRVRFLPPARGELRNAVHYYNLQRDRLGDEFRDEAWETIQRIEAFPLAWHLLGGNIRRCLMRRFPYAVVYEPGDFEIVVIAIACLHRKPEYWRPRTS